jgi:hypothetical protein
MKNCTRVSVLHIGCKKIVTPRIGLGRYCQNRRLRLRAPLKLGLPVCPLGPFKRNLVFYCS